MAYSEVIEERNGLRVRLVNDEGPPEPDFDGQSPLLRIDTRHGGPCEHVNVGGRPADGDDRIEEAAGRWGGPKDPEWPKFEKYLRAYHGVTRIVTYWSETYWYVTYDSAAWREYAGAQEGSADLDEYKAWCEGDVWGFVIERPVTWSAQGADLPDRTTWEDAGPDSHSWGYYGHDYAEQSAREAFAAWTRPDTTESPL